MYIHKNGIALRKLEKTDLPKLKDLKNESWFGTHNITLLNDYEQEKWFESLSRHTHLILIAIDTKTNNEVGLYKIQNIDWYNRTILLMMFLKSIEVKGYQNQFFVQVPISPLKF